MTIAQPTLTVTTTEGRRRLAARTQLCDRVGVPELPEVEITRRQLAPLLVGRRIRDVRTTANSYFFLTPPKTLRAKLRGRTTRELRRRGKHLIATLDDGASLLLHLGMTGQIFAASTPSVRLLASTGRGALTPERQATGFRPDAHTHVQLRFADDGDPVFFRDARKFGKVEWLAPGATSERLDGLGPDALRADGKHLFATTRKRRTAIKAVLLDQAVLAGVGNIYADEALFRAGVRPGRAAHRVTAAECDGIAKALRHVLRRAIATGGSSIRDYVQPSGRDGGYQEERMVYARAGQACQRCGTLVRNKTIAQRTSCYCPVCQR